MVREGELIHRRHPSGGTSEIGGRIINRLGTCFKRVTCVHLATAAHGDSPSYVINVIRGGRLLSRF